MRPGLDLALCGGLPVRPPDPRHVGLRDSFSASGSVGTEGGSLVPPYRLDQGHTEPGLGARHCHLLQPSFVSRDPAASGVQEAQPSGHGQSRLPGPCSQQRQGRTKLPRDVSTTGTSSLCPVQPRPPLPGGVAWPRGSGSCCCSYGPRAQSHIPRCSRVPGHPDTSGKAAL